MAYVTRIQIERCRNVRQLDIDLSVPRGENGTNGAATAERPRFRHLILTGPNGSGKSGVLEEVAREIDHVLAPPRQLTLFELNLEKLSWNHHTRVLPAMFEQGDVIGVYLPARRKIDLNPVRGPTRKERRPGDGTTRKELAPTLRQFLVNKHVAMTYATVNGDAAVADRARAWIGAFENNLRWLMEDPKLRLAFDERAYNFTIRKSDGYSFDLGTLADGHAAVLAILAELLIRVEAVREQRQDFTFEPEGVVIVDEIETHLHLALQEQILPFLSDTFPSFQFLVATHSPPVIASIPNAVVYDLKTREPTLSDHYRGVRYGALMKEHFGLPSDIDADSTEKLLRARALLRNPSRTRVEERELSELTTLLTARSPALGADVWIMKTRASYEADLSSEKGR